MKLYLLLYVVFCGACILDVTPDPDIPPPLVCDAGTEDAGK